MKILAFAASNSTQSINLKLVKYAKNLLEKMRADIDVEILDINDYEMPLFSVDREKQLGQPELAKAFFQKIGDADAIVISFAEHNGSYTAAYKNLFDWTSRIDVKVYQNKPMVLLSTSPGAGGASRTLSAAENALPHYGGDVKSTFSLPRFRNNFDQVTGQISNPDDDQKLRSALAML